MKFSNVRDGTIDIVRKHRGGFSDKHTFTHQGEGGLMPMFTWVNSKVRTLIGRGGSPRMRMFAYKGVGSKLLKTLRTHHVGGRNGSLLDIPSF